MPVPCVAIDGCPLADTRGIQILVADGDKHRDNSDFRAGCEQFDERVVCDVILAVAIAPPAEMVRPRA